MNVAAVPAVVIRGYYTDIAADYRTGDAIRGRRGERRASCPRWNIRVIFPLGILPAALWVPQIHY